MYTPLKSKHIHLPFVRFSKVRTLKSLVLHWPNTSDEMLLQIINREISECELIEFRRKFLSKYGYDKIDILKKKLLVYKNFATGAVAFLIDRKVNELITFMKAVVCTTIH